MNSGRRRFLAIAGVLLLGPVKVFAESGCLPSGPSVRSAKTRRWAMVVDAKRCRAGCSECIKACSAVHGPARDSHEAFAAAGRRITKKGYSSVFLWPESAFLQEYADRSLSARRYPAFCNQCDDPPCVAACSSRATWKRADGIVAVDSSRCIGCGSCIASCCYGARSFAQGNSSALKPDATAVIGGRNATIVEKCTFCAERLAQGDLPACVEACEAHALVCGDLADPASEVRELLRTRPAMVRLPHLGTAPRVFYLA